MISFVYLIGGLVLILLGANYLTDGSSALAKKMGVSDLVIGLTVVALGTSAPELVISIMSAVGGSSELAVGNVVGSNIFNILVIIGVTAMVRPIHIERSIMTREIPFVILSSVAVMVMANGPWLEGSTAAPIITRADGLILLLFFAIYMRYVFSQATAPCGDPSTADPVEEQAAAKPLMPGWRAAVYIVGGLAALIIGGEAFVDGATEIAKSLGVSEAVIGLTIVALGTSLPELATSVTAALKGSTGIALGNVIGSNIFNVFLVLGASASITPLPLGKITNLDFMTLTMASLLFWAMGWWIGNRTITRAEGALLVASYIAYMTVLL